MNAGIAKDIPVFLVNNSITIKTSMLVHSDDIRQSWLASLASYVCRKRQATILRITSDIIWYSPVCRCWLFNLSFLGDRHHVTIADDEIWTIARGRPCVTCVMCIGVGIWSNRISRRWVRSTAVIITQLPWLYWKFFACCVVSEHANMLNIRPSQFI